MRRKAMSPADRLVRTSVQIPPAIIERLDAWPGLTRSEALREILQHYLYATPDPRAAYLQRRIDEMILGQREKIKLWKACVAEWERELAAAENENDR